MTDRYPGFEVCSQCGNIYRPGMGDMHLKTEGHQASVEKTKNTNKK